MVRARSVGRPAHQTALTPCWRFVGPLRSLPDAVARAGRQRAERAAGAPDPAHRRGVRANACGAWTHGAAGAARADGLPVAGAGAAGSLTPRPGRRRGESDCVGHAGPSARASGCEAIAGAGAPHELVGRDVARDELGGAVEGLGLHVEPRHRQAVQGLVDPSGALGDRMRVARGWSCVRLTSMWRDRRGRGGLRRR